MDTFECGDTPEIEPQPDDCPEDRPYDGGGWPGDGSGTDDFADFNANEADDYQGE